LAAYKPVTSYQEVPKYPSIGRDIAFVIDQSILADDIKKVIEEVGKPLVKDVSVFDVYEGENLEVGKKSVAYHIVYQHPEKTLTDDEIQASYDHIIDAVKEKYQAYIRS